MNPPIAELISRKLADGLPHPGDPANGVEPVTIRLPLFRMAGMPAEIYEQVDATVKLLGEAIVYAIETEGDSVIVPKSELEALRAELAESRGTK